MRMITLISTIIGISVFSVYKYVPTNLVIGMKTDPASVAQIYFDTGYGYSENESYCFKMVPTENVQSYIIPLPSSQRILSLRLDPMNEEGNFEIQSIKIQNRYFSYEWIGNELKKAFIPLQQIKITDNFHPAFTGYSIGKDPFLHIQNIPPIPNQISLIYRIVIMFLCILVMMTMGFLVVRTEIVLYIKTKLVMCLQHVEWNNPQFVTLLLMVSYLFFTIVRFVISLVLQNPLAMSDEVQYKTMAYSFFKTGNFYDAVHLGFALHAPNILYQLLISVSFFFEDNFFVVMKLLNSLIMNTALFAFYGIMKNFVSSKKAFFLSILILLLPYFNYINFVLVEALYFPLFWYSFLFTYKTFKTLQVKHAILTGFFISLLYWTKPTAVAFILGLVITYFLMFLCLLRNKEKIMLRNHFLLFIFTIGTALFSIIFLNLVIKGSFSLFLGNYQQFSDANILSFFFSLSKVKMLSQIAGHFSTFFLIYLVPFLLIVWGLEQKIRERSYHEMFFLLLGINLCFIYMVMVIRMDQIILDVIWKRLNGRYYNMTFPFFPIAMLIFWEKMKWNRKKQIILSISFLLCSLVNIFFILPFFNTNWFLVCDNPDLIWYFFYGNYFSSFTFSIVCSVIALIMTMCYFRYHKKHLLFIYVSFLMILVIMNNYAVAVTMIRQDFYYTSQANTYKNFIRNFLPDFRVRVAIITHYPEAFYHIPFWFPYHYTIHPGILLPQDSSITKEMIPENTEFLIVLGDYHFTFPIEKNYRNFEKTCRIISLKTIN